MERLRKARSPLRRMFKAKTEEIKTELGKESPDDIQLKIMLDRLEAFMSEINKIDSDILNTLLDEDCAADEYRKAREDMEKFDEEWSSVRIKVTDALYKSRPASPQMSLYSTANCTTTSPTSRAKKNYRLPKIEIKKFGGDIREWLGWWSQFKKIDEDGDIDHSDKFQYLHQAMVPGTRAADLVNSYPMTSDNYPKVIQALKARFGKEKMLMQVYVRELLKMVINNNSSYTSQKLKTAYLYDSLESHLRSLESLGVTTDQMAVFLFPMVESSLSDELLVAWQRSPLNGRDGSKDIPPKTELDHLMEFLRREVEHEDQRELVHSGFSLSPSSSAKRPHPQQSRIKPERLSTAAGLFAGSGSSQSCIFCEKSHSSQDCGKAQSMSLQEKSKKVRDSKVCFSCLRGKHNSKACKAFVKCVICTRKHFPLMCPDLPSHKKEEPARSSKEKAAPDVSSDGETSQAMSNHSCSGQVLLHTLLVRIVAPQSSHVARLIFDNGSQRSYIRRACALKLKLPSCGQEWIRKSLFGGTITKSEPHNKYSVQIESLDGTYATELPVLDEIEICGRIRRIPKGPWISQLAKRNIHLTDYASENPEIEILVGSDHYGQFMTGRISQLDGLTAFQSVFGWTIGGKLPRGEKSHAMLVTSLLVQEFSIQDLWKLETIGISDPSVKKSKEESEAEASSQFLKTVKRDEGGRYSISLPWVDGAQEIPTNRSIAEKRLVTTTKKLESKDRVKDYDELFRGWLEEGIIEEVSKEEEMVVNCHYLPHHPVFKPESTTTPVRPVYDASCKSGRSPSLNQCLHKGPNLLEIIPSVLHRFREKKVGVVSDIRKAFQMIDVNRQDRDYLRFLWWEDPVGKKVIKTYRHKRVVFGLNCSPFLLAAVLELHLKATEEPHQLIADKLLRSLYVDNCVTSVDTDQDYESFKSVSIQIMSRAKMELRCWERSSSGQGESHVTSVLGLNWDTNHDHLSCKVKQEQLPTIINKRIVLSHIQRVFDPLGIICAAMLPPKLILQRGWATTSGWEDQLPETDAEEFRKWYSDLPLLKEIKIPRQFGTSDSLELHMFCDASQDGYAAVVFTRDTLSNSVAFIQAKSRVAPLKKMTIPRLELLSCLIGARLIQSIKEALNYDNVPTHYWTDSTTALAWIRRNDQWGTFVGNRVKEIITLSQSNAWRHVPGVMNPADLPSRGCTIAQLLHSKWWEGPSWLINPKQWPKKEESPDEELVSLETKRTATFSKKPVSCKTPEFSYLKTVRIGGWIRRFANNCKKSKEERELHPFLSINEIRVADLELIKQIQSTTIPAKAKEAFGLEIAKGADGIIRVMTRITQRQDSDEFLCPILLPKCHSMTELIIRECHLTFGHIGVQALLGKLRERFWIPQGRATVRAVVNKCPRCKRFTAKRMEVEPSVLPSSRVSNCEVFDTTGVDLLGPLYLKNGSKCWVVLYTCSVYRAVVLDPILSLSSEAFLESLQRFINVYGRPNTIYSDNGTNFVGASNLFKSLPSKTLDAESPAKQIQWIFNPPTAAWWGGWWERLVRTTKDLLKRNLGKARLTYDKLRTCLTAVQSSINDRPLTTLSEDVEDLVPLTPSMFLKGKKSYSFPEGLAIAGDLPIIYKRSQILQRDLQARFRSEYLSQLVQHSQEKKSSSPQVGDLVLVGADNKKRVDWPLGRIMELIPGRDSKTRVAKVKTTSGVLLRPLQRLFPLEISSSPDCPPVTEEVKKIAIKAQNHSYPEEIQVITRSGRISKKPSRLGQ